jgi:hypothetical protein
MKLRSTAGCEKPACPVVWEGAGAQSPASDPIVKFCMFCLVFIVAGGDKGSL